MEEEQIRDSVVKLVWKIKNPLKTKKIIWLVLANKIFTGDNCGKIRWNGPCRCTLCENIE